jgi:hypothetical protein
MSRITKAQADQFNKEFHALAAELGFRPYVPDPCGHGCGKEAGQWAMTRYGRFHLSSHGTDPGDHAFWVYGRFTETKAHDMSGSGASMPSGKFNHYGYTITSALQTWARAMHSVGIRPPTPEEVEQYDAADLAQYAEAAIDREELKKSLGV